MRIRRMTRREEGAREGVGGVKALESLGEDECGKEGEEGGGQGTAAGRLRLEWEGGQ